MGKPILLDLFCGAGGCSQGYVEAGFDVIGVDLYSQKRYPFAFRQDDAIGFLLRHGREFDAIHASPPCQEYTQLKSLNKHKKYPDLVAKTRDALREIGKPWVIENVPGSPLLPSVILCGAMFKLRVYRHRLFEASFPMLAPPHPVHVDRVDNGRQRLAHYAKGGFLTVCGNVGKYSGDAMGIDWMSGKELSQAIPPAYTKWIGVRLMKHLKDKR